jgi:hypothetical protein
VHTVNSLRLALEIAFERRRAFIIAFGSGLGMLALLAWNSGGLKYYARTGWEFYFEPVEFASILALSALFGLLVPLQLAAIVKARAGLGAASGVAAVVAAVVGMSCCAPLLLPALLSFIGFSGTMLLGFNVSVRRLAGPLELASVVMLMASIVLVSRTLTASCHQPRSSSGSGKLLCSQGPESSRRSERSSDRGVFA